MALVGLDRRAVLEADQNCVDLMKLEPPECALHRGLELLDGHASQNVVRADLPEYQVRQLERDLIHEPFGRLSRNLAAHAALADVKVSIFERPLQNVLKLERVAAIDRRGPNPEGGG